MGTQDIEKIEGRIDKVVAGAMPIDMSLGGIQLTTMMELFELAKMMAISDKAVPKHLRGNPGACLAVGLQALEWKMSPFAVANKSYEVNDRIAYEAQLIVAVINSRAPLVERLRYSYEGEGVEMRCTVTGRVKGEATSLEYVSPKIKDVKVKNSPLWLSDPQQQLSYYSGRAWCRRHCPDVLLGIYSADELENSDPIGSSTTTVRPEVGQRLKGNKGRGFSEDGVTKALAHTPGATLPTTSGKKEPATTHATASQPVIDVEPEPMTLALDPAAETEIENKKKALVEVDDLADLKALVEAGTAYLKAEKRTDLLPDFLSVADKRAKAIEKKAGASSTHPSTKSEF